MATTAASPSEQAAGTSCEDLGNLTMSRPLRRGHLAKESEPRTRGYACEVTIVVDQRQFILDRDHRNQAINRASDRLSPLTARSIDVCGMQIR
jgi:hypothetical protein